MAEFLAGPWGRLIWPLAFIAWSLVLVDEFRSGHVMAVVLVGMAQGHCIARALICFKLVNR
jgi:hypothetical protein